MKRELHTQGIGLYIKEIIYGANDGIITTFAVVAGVLGAHLSSTVILILGFANLLADGFSMAASNFLGSRSGNELYLEEERREYDEIEKFPDHEREEIRHIFLEQGYVKSDADQLTNLVSKNKHFWVNFMMRYELHMHQEGAGEEFKSALFTFFAFVIAGCLPLLPFLVHDTVDSFMFSIFSTGTSLFFVGAMRTLVTRKGVLWSGMEMLIVGGIAAFVAYMVGYLVSGIV